MSFINDIRRAIENYKTSLEALSKEQVGGKGLSIFAPAISPHVEYLSRLAEGLHENMSANDLADKIIMLENTRVLRSSWFGNQQETTVGNLCKEQKQSILHQASLNSSVSSNNPSVSREMPLPPAKTKNGTEFITLLTDMHAALYQLYETAKNNQHFYELSRSEIQQSPHLRKIENGEGYSPRSALVDFGRGISVEGITISSVAPAEEKYMQIREFANNDIELTDLITSLHQGVYAEIHYAVGDRLTTNNSRNMLISGGVGVTHWKKDKNGKIYADVEAWTSRVKDIDTDQLYCINAETRSLMKIVNVDMKWNANQYQPVDEEAFEYKKLTNDENGKKGEIVKEMESLLIREKSERSLEEGKRREILPRIYTVNVRIELQRIDGHYKPVITSFHVELDSMSLHIVNKNQRTLNYTKDTVAGRPLFVDFERAAQGRSPAADLDETLWTGDSRKQIESMRIITNERIPTQPVLATFIALHGSTIVPLRIMSEFESQLRVKVEPQVNVDQPVQAMAPRNEISDQGWTVHSSRKIGNWKMENGKINNSLEMEVFSLKANNGDIYVLDSSTNKLRMATAIEIKQLTEGGFHGAPIATVSSLIQLNNVNGHAVPSLKQYSVSFYTLDAGLHAERRLMGRAISTTPSPADATPSSSSTFRGP